MFFPTFFEKLSEYLAVSKSTDPGRSEKAKVMLSKVHSSGVQQVDKGKRKHHLFQISRPVADLISFADKLFDQLIKVCNYDVKQKKTVPNVFLFPLNRWP